MSLKILMYAVIVFMVAVLDLEAAPRIVGRASCPRVRLRYGRAKIRLRGRMVYFSCRTGYELYGKRIAVCVGGNWNQQKPVCVEPGCTLPKLSGNVTYTVSFKGAVLTYSCPLGYTTREKEVAFCQKDKWSSPPPVCTATQAAKSCDFEDEHLCEWYQDKTDSFDWTRKSGPTQTVKTGPDEDHTHYNSKLLGYYMYTEASSPRVTGDRARLLSPLYSGSPADTCFTFWYFMYGKGVGTLNVYVKQPDTPLKDLNATWTLSGNQLALWRRAQMEIPPLTTSYQIIFESVRSNSYYGDIAIDDVALRNCSQLKAGDNTTPFSANTTVVPTTGSDNVTTEVMNTVSVEAFSTTDASASSIGTSPSRNSSAAGNITHPDVSTLSKRASTVTSSAVSGSVSTLTTDVTTRITVTLPRNDNTSSMDGMRSAVTSDVTTVGDVYTDGNTSSTKMSASSHSQSTGWTNYWGTSSVSESPGTKTSTQTISVYKTSTAAETVASSIATQRTIISTTAAPLDAVRKVTTAKNLIPSSIPDKNFYSSSTSRTTSGLDTITKQNNSTKPKTIGSSHPPTKILPATTILNSVSTTNYETTNISIFIDLLHGIYNSTPLGNQGVRVNVGASTADAASGISPVVGVVVGVAVVVLGAAVIVVVALYTRRWMKRRKREKTGEERKPIAHLIDLDMYQCNIET